MASFWTSVLILPLSNEIIPTELGFISEIIILLSGPTLISEPSINFIFKKLFAPVKTEVSSINLSPRTTALANLEPGESSLASPRIFTTSAIGWPVAQTSKLKNKENKKYG